MKIIYKHILPLLLIILPAINLRPEQGTAYVYKKSLDRYHGRGIF